jgi:hypothetical protein
MTHIFNLKKEIKEEIVENNTLENKYRVLEKIIELVIDSISNNKDFDVNKINDCFEFNIWKKKYEKGILRNTCNLLANDETRILNDIIIDLLEIYTPFTRDPKHRINQLKCFKVMGNEDTKVLDKNNYKNNLSLLIKYTKLNLGLISAEEVTNSSLYKNWVKREEIRYQICSSSLKHDKGKTLDEVIKILNYNLIEKNIHIEKSLVK